MNTKQRFLLLSSILPIFLVQVAPGQANSSANGNRVSLLLVGHGGPAKDFPKLTEYFKLHGKNSDEARKIEDEMAHWPRTEHNDAYWGGFMKIARSLEQSRAFSSMQIAFNEMCAPSVEEALDELAKQRPDTILVTSIMVTPGGVHSEKDIPLSIENFKEQHPDIVVIYAWPYDTRLISSFVVDHVKTFTGGR